MQKKVKEWKTRIGWKEDRHTLSHSYALRYIHRQAAGRAEREGNRDSRKGKKENSKEGAGEKLEEEEIN